ncbi:hypothetical protein ORD22_06775 [Sporosarcina sp. GW1-11]|uniref:hypothetical protein n=1 Tax=Sporosarcina sp. GW1-11 TaxID=2899126 RepID=UPI00294EB972|nr:hypothetical protein [Sporosarcina sp. GW1-11]MDV6377966.1 hypothetical protein [Sporosarcina sp. GW1-11]
MKEFVDCEDILREAKCREETAKEGELEKEKELTVRNLLIRNMDIEKIVGITGVSIERMLELNKELGFA